MDRADTIYATEVNANIEGDAFMPKMNEKEWSKTILETHQQNERNDYGYEIIEYNRVQ
jgi:dihydrofolate reductase